MRVRDDAGRYKLAEHLNDVGENLRRSEDAYSLVFELRRALLCAEEIREYEEEKR